MTVIRKKKKKVATEKKMLWKNWEFIKITSFLGLKTSGTRQELCNSNDIS